MRVHVAELTLAADEVGSDSMAARRARQFVADFLAERKSMPPLDLELVDDVLLAVSELVTNAVVHTHRAPTLAIRLQPDHSLRVEITDGDDAQPIVKDDDPQRVGGHGMRIVSAVAARWGVEPHCDGGKTVWAVFGGAPDSTGRG